jgi:hypothetical protein
MADFKLSTPVVFAIFNRPEKTAQVFAEIARARPPKLLIVADGPRAARAGEAELCLKARKIIEKVDWPCEVITNISEVNLGCRKRMSSGVSWAFQQVPEAIVLEDDCVPGASFFRYCEEMLNRYRENESILMVSGSNILEGKKKFGHSYYFSQIPTIWGWASWSNVWNKYYDIEMKFWPEFRSSDALSKLFNNRDTEEFWVDLFEKSYNGKIDTWEYPWICASFRHRLLSVVPTTNLIHNIGFGADATHTFSTNSPLANIEKKEIEFPLVHPSEIRADAEADSIFQFKIAGRGLRRKLLRIVRSLLGWV